MLENKLKFVLESMARSLDTYQSFNDADVTVEYIEAIASLRHGLSFTANLISKCYQTDRYYESLQPVEKQLLHQLFDEAKKICFHIQPCEYFIKFIVRQYGIQFLKKIVDHSEFDWLIPPHLKSEKEVCLLLIQL